jgi:hypothetical protein
MTDTSIIGPFARMTHDLDERTLRKIALRTLIILHALHDLGVTNG